MTARIYTPDATGRCTGCQRPEAEHSRSGGWEGDEARCPPVDLAIYRTSDEAEHQHNLRMHLMAMSTPELVETSKRLARECHAVIDADEARRCPPADTPLAIDASNAKT